MKYYRLEEDITPMVLELSITAPSLLEGYPLLTVTRSDITVISNNIEDLEAGLVVSGSDEALRLQDLGCATYELHFHC